MKKIIMQIGKPSKADSNGNIDKNTRENTIRSVADTISNLPNRAGFQVTISNTPTKYEVQAFDLRVGLRIIAGKVSKHSKAKGKEYSADDAYFLIKKKYAVGILRKEDNAIDFQFTLLENYLKENNEKSAIHASSKINAAIHAVVNMKKISNEGLIEIIESATKFWESKGVKL